MPDVCGDPGGKPEFSFYNNENQNIEIDVKKIYGIFYLSQYSNNLHKVMLHTKLTRLDLLIKGISYIAPEVCGLNFLQFIALKGSLTTVSLKTNHI